MKFYQALEVNKGITAIIGGGGKTSLMLKLGEELASLGRVIVCTTTHIFRPEDMLHLEAASEGDVEKAFEKHNPICLGEWEGVKLISPKLPMERLRELADYVIVEADGSKKLPLKAHNQNEPCIPENAHVIYVIGADGIGKPVSEAAHRSALYAKALGVEENHVVTPKDAASMVDYGSIVLFNKADIEDGVAKGLEFAKYFPGKTVIASLERGEIYEIKE